MKDQLPLVPAPVSPMPVAPVAPPAPSVGHMLQAVLEKGVTADNVAAVEKIVELYERTQAKESEKLFAEAFIELQREIPRIKATKPVNAKDGTLKYMVATPEEIDAELRPLALKHGFVYSFEEAPTQQPGRVTKICIVTHKGGHSRRNAYSARVGQGPPGSTESQADGAAHSYAKRGALCDAFNIVIDRAFHADDPRALGDFVTKEQAEELQRRVIESDSNERAFLQFCGVTAAPGKPTLADYEKIGANQYDRADEMLRKKEQRGR